MNFLRRTLASKNSCVLRMSCFLMLLTLSFANAPVLAQVDYSTATLKGTVFDSQAKVISGARITAVNAATGGSWEAKTGTDGLYQIQALPPGSYDVSVEVEGFKKSVIKNLQLSVGQTALYDVHMVLGGITETLQVSAEDSVPLIQTEQSQQANTIDSRQIDNLPNINRAFNFQVYTLPGVTNSEAPRTQQPGFTGYLTTGFSIGGSNGRNNLSTIDGGENEYGTGAYRVTALPADAIQEYQVNRNAFAAEFGFTDGSAINIVTRTGTNAWHGNVFGYYRNQDTESSNYINRIAGFPKAFNQDIFSGASIGGPLVKDKLFIFAAYEFQKFDTPNFGNAGLLTQPTVLGISDPALVANDTPTVCAAQFAAHLPDQICYIDALRNSGNPFLIGFSNGITPGLSPLNNPALNQILHRDSGIFNSPDRLHNTILRLDYRPGDRDSFSLRGIYAHNNFTSAQQAILNGTPDSYRLQVRDVSILGTWTRSINPSLLNQLIIQIVPRSTDNAVPLNFNGVNFSLGNLGATGPGGTSTFGAPALLPYLAHQQRYQFEDNITWTHGQHTLKLGASFRPANYHVQDNLWFNPEFDFRDGAIPLISLAPAAVQAQLVGFNLANGLPAAGPLTTNLSAPQSFAFGIPTDVIAGFNNPKWQGWGKYFGSYIQDSWKVNSRLTVNAGVRFDVDGEPTPIGSSFYASPRLGFAWDPFGDHKTVIRAGGGIYVASVDILIPSYGSLLDGSGRYINETFATLSPTDPRVAALWQTGVAKGELPFGSLTPADYAAVGIPINIPGASVGYSVASNYKNPYSLQASLSIDHQLARGLSLEVSYIMYRGVHLQMPVETAYGVVPAGSSLCPNPSCTDASGGPIYMPNTGQVQHTTYSSIGNSIYHGATASLTKHFGAGLQFQANYTFSKTIDDVLDFSSFQNWFRPSQLHRFRGVSAYDIPQSFVANAVYTTPFKTGSGNVLSSIFADIALSPVFTAHSGLPFSVRTPSLSTLPVALGGNGVSVDSNFAMPFLSSRDNNRGDSFYSFDGSFQKSVFLDRDRGMRLSFIVEVTNLFNRTNFDKVNDVFDTGGFGTVTLANGHVLNLATGPYTGLHGIVPTNASQLSQPLFFSSADLPRQFQFGLKFAF